jgi:hypothetical protein
MVSSFAEKIKPVMLYMQIEDILFLRYANICNTKHKCVKILITERLTWKNQRFSLIYRYVSKSFFIWVSEIHSWHIINIVQHIVTMIGKNQCCTVYENLMNHYKNKLRNVILNKFLFNQVERLLEKRSMCWNWWPAIILIIKQRRKVYTSNYYTFQFCLVW